MNEPMDFAKVMVPLDANRLATRVKNIKDDSDADNEKLLKFFEKIRIGHVNEPATVVDIHGSILVWYLPDILTQTRVASPLLLMTDGS
jgi:hypothetical protein